MVVRKLKEASFKEAKLQKTGARRKSMASQRRVADQPRRNDLLPQIAYKVVKVADLEVGKHKVRKSNQDQIERVARSISVHGFCVPLLVRGKEIIDGNIRVAAARQLGLEELPASDVSHLDDIEIRTLRLALNRIGERGEWDLDALRLEFLELTDLEVNLPSTGFSIEEADIIMLDPLDGEDAGSDDDIPEPKEQPVSQLGDVWELGDHRILCGDALAETNYHLLLDGEQPANVTSDPPYNVPIKGHVSGLGKKVHDEFAMASGEMSPEEFEAFLYNYLTVAAAMCLPGSVLFVFMDWRSIARLVSAGERAGLKLINIAVWYKESGAMGGLYRSAHEMVAVFCKGDSPHTNNVALGKNGRDRQNVWCAPGANRRGSSANAMLHLHATPKPIELLKDMLLDVTQPGDIVLDAFLGSGSTLIAAEQTRRRCRGIEIEPRFVDVTIERWQQLTGIPAILVETRQTFAEVTADRLIGASHGEEANDG